MEQNNSSDDEVPPAMLSSWIILSKLGQKLPNKPPVITDLQKLCKAANQCTQNIHNQLLPLFRSCSLPLSSHQEPHEFVVIYNLSPVNEFLRTLQLIDPQESAMHTPLIEDYQPLSQASCTLQIAATQSKPHIPELSQPVVPSARIATEPRSSIKQLFSTAIAYPLYPFATVFAFVRKQTHFQEPIAPMYSTHEPSRIQVATQKLSTRQAEREEQDPSLVNHEKYQRVLTHSKKLLKGVLTADTEALKLLAQLKEQLITLQATITANIERIEADRASFNNLQQCVCAQDMTLSDELLLQYCKMSPHNATLEKALSDFKLEGQKLTDVTQEQFEARWQKIQELHRTGTMSAETFNQMRQYSYILQNVTSRHLAQAFLDGTINAYGMTHQVARERGLTQERIAQLTSELSNCKDFLLQLKRAFNDSLKLIDKAIKQ